MDNNEKYSDVSTKLPKVIHGSYCMLKTKEQYLAARAHVTQECIGAILDEIENVHTNGFTARIKKEGLLRLHPFLLAVRVDSKERKKYFGLKSDRFYTYMRHTYEWSYMSHTYDWSYMSHTYD